VINEYLKMETKNELVVDYPKRNKRLMIWLVVLTTFTIIDYYIRDQLFDYSIPYLKAIVPHRTPIRTTLAAIISELSDKYCFIVFIGLGYWATALPKAFIIAVTLATNLASLCIIKQLISEARPFFVHDLVPTKCWHETGNPSGHAYISSAVYLTLWRMLCREYKMMNRVISFAITIGIILAVACCRLYNGVHTFN
jgi:membrane-associated phospholipid phosphatase